MLEMPATASSELRTGRNIEEPPTGHPAGMEIPDKVNISKGIVNGPILLFYQLNQPLNQQIPSSDQQTPVLAIAGFTIMSHDIFIVNYT